MRNFHESVLLKEAVDALNIKPGELYVDATLGGGGHTAEIIRRGGKVIGIDVDPSALKYVEREIKSDTLILEQGNFLEVDEIIRKHTLEKVVGVLLDLGVSSFQLDSPERGFGFRHSAELDMRMDPTLTIKATDLINGLNEGELYELFTKYGEERNARRIARAIVRSRQEKKIERTDQLALIVESSVGRSSFKIHPATRVFLALRIAVNSELNNLKEVLPKAESNLRKDGRLVVISFHSLEDKIVKDFIKKSPELEEVNKKPILPTHDEIDRNPRSRSAKMRIAVKVR